MYQSWKKRDSKNLKLISNLKAFLDLKKELEGEIENISEDSITSHELKRDFGFSGQGIILAKKTGLLQPASSTKRSQRYPVKTALKYCLNYPELARLQGTRINRRKKRGQSLLKDLVNGTI